MHTWLPLVLAASNFSALTGLILAGRARGW